MILKKFLHATQYYRSPTPLNNEWDKDIEKIGQFGIDTIQIRLNWRWNERIEDVYNFDDVDGLLDIAEKYEKKVIIKFLLECAPQYIYDKYGGTRIAHDGTKLSPGSHGAFYGGFRPCFTNPLVMARAVKFVEEVAKRYSGRKCIIFWNAWNEIRNAPAEECFCPHCRKAFANYLEKKFGSIEKLNKFYGTAEESFESIAMPSMARGYWDIFEFKKFKAGSELQRWLKCVYDAVKKYDDRPVMAHAGCPSVFQDTIEDNCEDMVVSKAVDFYGTSTCLDTIMDTSARRLDFMMLNDFVRSIDENYVNYEIYPGLGMFRDYDSRYDMKFKQYAAVACGAKGINYWQWRAERVGHEGDCAGLAKMSGEPREVAKEVAEFSESLKKDGDTFLRSKVKQSDVAILFDYDSGLMSAIEDHCVENSFKRNPNARGYYHGAVKGAYRLLANLDANADFVQSASLGKLIGYKFMYVPHLSMLKPDVAKAIEKFVYEGGVVLADEGFGMRQENTWMQPYDIECKPMLNARMDERRICNGAETIRICGESAAIYPFKTTYDCKGEELASFSDGSVAMRKISYGKGSFYLCGFSVGYSYLKTCDIVWLNFVVGILNEAKVRKAEYAADDIYEKRLVSGNREIVFLFNNSGSEKEILFKNDIESCGADAKHIEKKVSLCGKGIGYVITVL